MTTSTHMRDVLLEEHSRFEQLEYRDDFPAPVPVPEGIHVKAGTGSAPALGTGEGLSTGRPDFRQEVLWVIATMGRSAL